MTIALLAVALLAGADAAAPPGQEAEALPRPAPVLDLAGVLTIMGGAAGEQRVAPAGGLEGALLVRRGILGAGLRLGLDANPDNLSAGGGLLAGAVLDVAGQLRLDLLGEVGAQFYSHDGSSSFLGSTTTTGSKRTLLALGVRAGVSPLTPSGSRLSVGVFARLVERAHVTYQVQDCSLFGFCTTASREADYGGGEAGVFLAWAWDWQVKLPAAPASPAQEPEPQGQQ